MSLTLTLERGGGEVSGSGTNIELDGTIAGGAIESVEMYGDTEQTTYSGKNLLKNLIILNATDNGVSNTLNSDGSITCSGTVGTGWNGWGISGYTANELAAGTYTFSIDHAITSDITVSFRDSSNNTIGAATITAGQTSSTVTIAGQTARTSLWVSATTGTQTNFTIKAQLESGSTATSFEPYVGGTASPNPDYPQEVQTVTGEQTITVSNGQGASQVYPINLGKNLFDDSQNFFQGYINSNTGVDVAETVSFVSNQYIPVEGGASYTYSSNSAMRYQTVYSYDGSKTFIKREINAYNKTETSFTVANNAKYIRVGGSKDINTTITSSVIEALDIQIEKGSTATTYAPYFEPIELCKIGDYQDYIYKSGEDWYVHKETGKVTFTGAETETWSSAAAATGYVRFSIASGATHADNNGYCNELINRGSQSHGAYEYVWVQPNANAFYIQLLNTRVSGLAAFKAWLASNPATVYCTLTTPTDTQITNSALIAQLDALNAGDTYEGTTVITVSSENLAGSLEVTASSNIAKTYTEVEIGSPFTITDVDGKSSNTTLDGNVYVDWAYNKKQYSFDLFNLTPQDYADIRAFYDYQFNNSAFPTITVPELNIDKLPVYMEISSRNIINQCLLTDKLTIKFRETVQP